jgi:hypothetical protein
VNLARPALLALGLAASAAAEAQTLFKCVGRDGKVSYQSEKCADAVRESTVRPPDPVAPRAAPAAEPAADAAKAPANPKEPAIAWDTFVAHVSSYENCAAIVPGFGPKHSANYQRWKEAHRTTVARFNQDGDAQRRVRESTEYVRGKMNARSAEQRQYDIDNCENTVAPMFAPQNPPTSTPTKN